MIDERGRKGFEILARENSRMLLAYLNSVVNDRAAVDDLYQETMVVAWRRLSDCDQSRPFGPWLRGIAGRLVMAHYRKRKKVPLSLDHAVLAQIEGQFEAISSITADTWDEKVASLQVCVDALPDSHQAAIRGRYFDNLQAPRLAERLGISAEACWKRLARARRMLADCLTSKGVLKNLEATS